MIKLAPYYKSVTAGVGEVVTAGAAITSLLALVPPSYHGVAAGMSVLLGVLGVVKVFYVWLVQNEPLATSIDAAIESAAPVVRDVQALNKHQAAEPVIEIASGAKVSAADVVRQLPPGFIPGPGAR